MGMKERKVLVTTRMTRGEYTKIIYSVYLKNMKKFMLPTIGGLVVFAAIMAFRPDFLQRGLLQVVLLFLAIALLAMLLFPLYYVTKEIHARKEEFGKEEQYLFTDSRFTEIHNGREGEFYRYRDIPKIVEHSSSFWFYMPTSIIAVRKEQIPEDQIDWMRKIFRMAKGTSFRSKA